MGAGRGVGVAIPGFGSSEWSTGGGGATAYGQLSVFGVVGGGGVVVVWATAGALARRSAHVAADASKREGIE